MIKTIFPTNVVIKDNALSESSLDELEAVIRAIFENHKSTNTLSHMGSGDNELPLFTEENLKSFPVLTELRESFIDGFYELAESYDDNNISLNDIRERVLVNTGRLPFMKKGDYKRIHTHVRSSAFAVFYLSNVDNVKEGGQIILRDPAFHNNYGFHPKSVFPIETKKNRLIISPAYVWHEVTPYSGEEDRIAIVMNLDF